MFPLIGAAAQPPPPSHNTAGPSPFSHFSALSLPGDDKLLQLKYLLIKCIGSNVRDVGATRLTLHTYI